MGRVNKKGVPGIRVKYTSFGVFNAVSLSSVSSNRGFLHEGHMHSLGA